MSEKVTLSIPNISCHHCTMTIERETRDVSGVLGVEASLEDKTATFTLENPKALTDVKALLAEIGYPAAG